MHHTIQDMFAHIAPPLRQMLACAATLAHKQDVTLWLVGGTIRDLLLGLPLRYDIDLAVEGDVSTFAQALATELGAQVIATHKAFGTATIVIPRATTLETLLSLDLAETRCESYPYPAALPIIHRADLATDLARRDFSINAMALKLHAVQADLCATTLIDPFDGQSDLQAGVLRVLHNMSFDDDPTRILRGLRLAARFNLQLEPHTQALLERALAQKRLEATSADRVRTELCLALNEPQPDAVLYLADTWQVTPHIFAPLAWNEALRVRWQHLNTDTRQTMVTGKHANFRTLLSAGMFLYDLSPAERSQLVTRYNAPGDVVKLARELDAITATLPQLTPSLSNSEIDRLLYPFGRVTLAVVYYAEPAPLNDLVERYVSELRDITPLLNGHALQQLGIPPGPRLGRLLKALRAARLDGLVTTQVDEEQWVLAQLDRGKA